MGMNRREFIAGLGSAVAVGPHPVDAQQSERMKRIGVLVGLAENDSEGQARIGAFREGLRELGWINGSNVRIDYRWAEDADRRQAYAAELVQLAPDVIVAAANPAGAAMQQATRTIPIVVPQMADPVTNGFVASLARPGGNITGFFLYDDGFGAKWLELLKEIAPRVNRVAVIYDPTNRSWAAMLREIEVAALSLGVQLTPAGVRDAADIQRAIDAFAREANGGLIVFPSPITTVHREFIVTLAARYRLPTVYPYRFFTSRRLGILWRR
jgi:putative ABC transport system substrate-binding protein